MYECGEHPEFAPVARFPSVSRVRLRLVHEPAVEFETASCRRPADAAQLIHPLVAGEPQEVVGALLLNGRHWAIGYTVPYRGTPSKAIVEARGLFVPALLTNASALIVFHNHPSGDPSPSREDRELTRQLIRAGEILGIRLLDHLVLGQVPRYVSLREQGVWDTLKGPQ